MYALKYADGVVEMATTAKDAYQRGASMYRLDKSMGFSVWHDDVCICTQKSGKDITLIEAEVPVRVYNFTLRRFQQLGLLAKGQRDVTMQQLHDLFCGRQMCRLRGAGLKTYEQIYHTLVEYMGLSGELQDAFIDCVSDFRGITEEYLESVLAAGE